MVKIIGKYDFYGTLGTGSFGKVKYAIDNETGEPVAIKIVSKELIMERNLGRNLKKEITIMKFINHENIVDVKSVFATADKLYIVMEYEGGGELFDKIVEVGKFTESTARHYFKQLIDGLEYCHEINVCHRDLKPENLLLDAEGNLKISDFGFSIMRAREGNNGENIDNLFTTCGTPNYVAPEVVSKIGYDGRIADLWSLGCVLYVLLAGYLPFDEDSKEELFDKIRKAEFEFPKWFTRDARNLINSMLVADPKKRATLQDIKFHYWMLKDNDEPPTIFKAPSLIPYYP